MAYRKIALQDSLKLEVGFNGQVYAESDTLGLLAAKFFIGEFQQNVSMARFVQLAPAR